MPFNDALLLFCSHILLSPLGSLIMCFCFFVVDVPVSIVLTVIGPPLFFLFLRVGIHVSSFSLVAMTNDASFLHLVLRGFYLNDGVSDALLLYALHRLLFLL
eukprot:TRINITY_DN9015_c0_g1_i1.p1 TRINITY_DN9015_c0_g1~~TRINITY_DN9015_c0_g1_i1.p1  ORF type:complete len:102 (-),score=7.40 TRINITY_DN9015_c0_g1_i1:259-564(-)